MGHLLLVVPEPLAKRVEDCLSDLFDESFEAMNFGMASVASFFVTSIRATTAVAFSFATMARAITTSRWA